MKLNNAKESLLIFLRGMFMGIADVIPGVSGGTVALITGIYARLIFAIRGINLRFLAYLLKGDAKKAKQDFLSMDFGLLIPLTMGIVIAFLIFSRVIRFLLTAFPANTYAFFFGLILASAVFVYRHVGGIDYKIIACGVCGGLFAFMFIGLESLQASHSLPVIFSSGMIAICAMILPGISGAFILFFLGQYEYMLAALHGLDLPVIGVFLIGALIGLFSMARVLGYLLHSHKSVTMAFLVGLMLGALRLPYQNIVSNAFHLPLVLVSGAAGFFAVIVLEKIANAYK